LDGLGLQSWFQSLEKKGKVSLRVQGEMCRSFDEGKGVEMSGEHEVGKVETVSTILWVRASVRGDGEEANKHVMMRKPGYST